MEVQPQLVLLQKTLLNIEGLGRQLYPDLNLWDTAHPFLERWIKERFHPKTLFKELKYHSPEWIEKFPEVPHMVYNAIGEIKTLAEIAPELREASQSLTASKSEGLKRKRRIAIAALALSCAGYIAWPSLNDVPKEAIGLALVALAALIL